MAKPQVNALLFVSALLLPSTYAADPAPATLGLEQALSHAAQHPRTQLAADALLRHPFPAPLYMDCHNLAYASVTAPDSQRDAPPDRLVSPQVAQGLEIMRRFFDVLLADQRAAYDTENMAVYYIPLDRARTRMKLKQFSEMNVAELDATYQAVRQQAAASTAAQRLSRELLAIATDTPANLPSDLDTPEIPALLGDQPALQVLVDSALSGNAWLKDALDDSKDAEREMLTLELRQHLLEALARLDIFKVAAERSKVDMHWRDESLDRSRTLYEQEVKADLGDAMAQQSKTKLEQQQIAYCQVMAVAELNALQGKPIWPFPKTTPRQEPAK